MATKRSGAETRQRLLDVGIEALANLDVADLVTLVGTRELARRAGVSPASFFHHFENAQAYSDALVEWLYSVRRSEAPVKVGVGVEAMRTTNLPLDQVFALHANEIRRITTDPEFRVRIGVWALGGASVDAAYGRYLAEVDDLIIPSLEALTDTWGREVRTPLEQKHYVSLHVAFSQGASLRHIVDPERMPISVFQRGASSVALAALRVKGDRRSIDDRLAEINYFPIRNVPVGDRAAMSRVRVLASAAELFGSYSYETTTVAMIARASQVSQATVYEHFGSKAGIAIGLLTKQAEDVLGARIIVDNAEDELHDGLVALAEFFAVRTDHAAPYLAALVCHSPSVTDADPLLTTTLRLLEDRHASLDSVERSDIARLVLGALISRTIAHPSDAAGDIATWVEAIIPTPVP